MTMIIKTRMVGHKNMVRFADANHYPRELHSLGHGAGAARGVLPRGHGHQPAPLALASGVPLRLGGQNHRRQGPQGRAVLLYAPADHSQVSYYLRMLETGVGTWSNMLPAL